MKLSILPVFLLISVALAAQSSAADPILQEFGSLQGQVSAAEWRQAHPEETLQRFTIQAANSEVKDWCARSQRQIKAGGILLVRNAYFYVPSNLHLPADNGPHPELIEHCVLGAIWITGTAPVQETDSEIESLRQELDSQFGQHQERLGPTQALFGSAFWKPLSLWHDDPHQTFYLIAKDRDQNLVAICWLPFSRLTNAAPDYDPVAAADAPLKLAEVFLPKAALPLEATGRMQQLIAAVRRFQTGSSVQNRLRSADAASVLADWIRAATAMPATQRAAALLAADQVLEAAMQSSDLGERTGSASPDWPENSRKLLQNLGATFKFSELDGGYLYQHDWMKRAQQLAPDSAAAQAIFLYLMNRGFDTSGTCGETEQFRRVIDQGKAYLTAHPDTAAAGEILFLIGDAYRDIVALAAGALPDYADRNQYEAEEHSARNSAIAYYRQAIAVAADNVIKEKATLAAWQLLAGMEPASTRFYCVYD